MLARGDQGRLFLGLRLDPELYEYYGKLAKESGLSLSEIIRVVLHEAKKRSVKIEVRFERETRP